MTTVAASSQHWLLSDGKSVDVTILYPVTKGQLILADGWLGIALSSGASGDTIAIAVDDRAYQFTVPATLAVNKGDIVYITVASVENGKPSDAAYSTAAGAGRVALFKALGNKDSNNVVLGKMLASAALAS